MFCQHSELNCVLGKVRFILVSVFPPIVNVTAFLRQSDYLFGGNSGACCTNVDAGLCSIMYELYSM